MLPLAGRNEMDSTRRDAEKLLDEFPCAIDSDSNRRLIFRRPFRVPKSAFLIERGVISFLNLNPTLALNLLKPAGLSAGLRLRLGLKAKLG